MNVSEHRFKSLAQSKQRFFKNCLLPIFYLMIRNMDSMEAHKTAVVVVVQFLSLLSS